MSEIRDHSFSFSMSAVGIKSEHVLWSIFSLPIPLSTFTRSRPLLGSQCIYRLLFFSTALPYSRQCTVPHGPQWVLNQLMVMLSISQLTLHMFNHSIYSCESVHVLLLLLVRLCFWRKKKNKRKSAEAFYLLNKFTYFDRFDLTMIYIVLIFRAQSISVVAANERREEKKERRRWRRDRKKPKTI